jgi:WD40 repeat protein
MTRKRLLATGARFGGLFVALVLMQLSPTDRAFAAHGELDAPQVSLPLDYPAKAREQVYYALHRMDCRFVSGFWLNSWTTLHYRGDTRALSMFLDDLAQCPGVTLSVSFTSEIDVDCDWRVGHKAPENRFQVEVNLKSDRIELDKLVVPEVHGAAIRGKRKDAERPDDARYDATAVFTAVASEPDANSERIPEADFLKLEGPVRSVVWSGDGKRFASISTRRVQREEGDELRFDTFTTVRIHVSRTGEELQSLGELKNPPYADYRFSPDGSLLALSHRNAIETGDDIELWDTETTHLRRRFSTSYARSRPVMAFSPNGKTLAVAFGGQTNQPTMVGARLFDLDTGAELKTLAEPGPTATSVAFSPDGSLLAVGGYLDSNVHVWDVRSGERSELTPGGVKGSPVVLEFSPDGTTLACGSSQGGVQLWDAATGDAKSSPEQNLSSCSRLSFSRDGKLLIGASRTRDGAGEVRIWDAQSGKMLLTLPDTSDSMAFAPDRRTLSVLIPGKGIRLVDVSRYLQE